MSEADQGKQKAKPRWAGRFSVVNHEDGWTALGSPLLKAGRLSYSRARDTYHASIREEDFLFPKLGRGNLSPEDSPLGQWKRPKVDFLFLFALRRMSMERSPGCGFDPFYWSKVAVRLSIAEQERKSGIKLAPKNLEYADKVSNSSAEFEKYVLSRLFDSLGRPGAGPLLRRYAKWMDLIDQTIEEGIPASYQRFLRAVESAAAKVKGVPTKKAVTEAFNEGLSDNQLGEGTTCRSLMKKLRFEWLPAGGRGPTRHPRKSGI